MNKLILGIIIGIVLVLSVRTAYAANKTFKTNLSIGDVQRIEDGNVHCYVLGSVWLKYGSISCVKVK